MFLSIANVTASTGTTIRTIAKMTIATITIMEIETETSMTKVEMAIIADGASRGSKRH